MSKILPGPMNDDDPPLRRYTVYAFILGVTLTIGAHMINVQNQKSSTNIKYYGQSGGGTSIDLSIVKPSHPDEEAIKQFYCDYGSLACNGDYVSNLVRISNRHGVDPYLITAISILESSGGLRACGFNWWGYASCAVRFSEFNVAVDRVAQTISGYGTSDPYVIASIWRTGTTNDPTNYPDKVIQLIKKIKRR